MKMIESIRNYILTCPYLKKNTVNIDWLGVSPTEYSIDGTPVEPIVKKYVDGGTIRQFNFILSSLEEYGQDITKNILNSGFYEDFENWIYTQNRVRILPQLDNGKTATGIECLKTGYLVEKGSDKAKYQMQCRLIYYAD